MGRRLVSNLTWICGVLALSAALGGCGSSRKVASPAAVGDRLGRTALARSSGASGSSARTQAAAGKAAAARREAAAQREAAARREAVRAAFVASMRAFYAAGRLGEPGYRALVSSFVDGSPALEQTEAWLQALVDAGAMAPSTYRIGDVRVTSISSSRATLFGCAYDTGSVYRSSGLPAPPYLGGGAGLTASVAVLDRVRGRWLVWSDQTSTPSSSKEEGPCRGY
jgi:hypothetical protein